MKYSRPPLFYIVFFILVFFAACQQSVTPSVDPEENRYYSAYRDIYKGYGTLPLDSTRQQLLQYLNRFPENADAWAFYGNILFKTGSYTEAGAAYRRAVAIDGQKGAYYSALASSYSMRNMDDSAEISLLKAISLKDTTGYTLLNFSLLYLKKGEISKSVKYAGEAEAKSDSSAIICSGLSYVYLNTGERQKSDKMLHNALAFGLKDTSGFSEVMSGKIKIEDYYRKNY